MELYQWENEVQIEKPVSVKLRPPKMPHGLGLYPSLHSERPVTDHLNHDMAAVLKISTSDCCGMCVRLVSFMFLKVLVTTFKGYLTHSAIFP